MNLKFAGVAPGISVCAPISFYSFKVDMDARELGVDLDPPSMTMVTWRPPHKSLRALKWSQVRFEEEGGCYRLFEADIVF